MSEEYDGPQTLWQCFWSKEHGFYDQWEQSEYLEEYILHKYGYDSKAWTWLYRYWAVGEFFEDIHTITRGDGLYRHDWETNITLREFLYITLIRSPFIRVWRYIKYDVLKMEYVDPHLGCYSYPNCDEAPNGCRHVMGSDVEEYGHKD